MKKKHKKEPKGGYPLLDKYASLKISLFFNVAFFTLGVIAIIGGIGYGLDTLLGTYPKFLIGGLIAGYPVTLFVLRSRYKKFAAKKLKEEKNGKS